MGNVIEAERGLPPGDGAFMFEDKIEQFVVIHLTPIEREELRIIPSG
jgi:hypothetical protein